MPSRNLCPIDAAGGEVSLLPSSFWRMFRARVAISCEEPSFSRQSILSWMELLQVEAKECVGLYMKQVACTKLAVINQYVAYHAKPLLISRVEFTNPQMEATHSSAASRHDLTGPADVLIKDFVAIGFKKKGAVQDDAQMK